jgi:hypothetical protein
MEVAEAQEVVMPWVEDLWRSRAESILGQIAAGETEYQEVANLAEHVGADYHGRFLIELLQNAEDQATRMGLDSATVIIVRTPQLVAVFNEGSPFDPKGIKAVTSAGISPKDAEKSLGNKGIGFKAVFQVSGHPEIYSAADGDGGSLRGRINAFRLDQAPFEDLQFRDRFERVLNELLVAEPGRRRKLEARFPGLSLVPALIGEFKQAAPFKFPKPLQRDALDGRLTELGVSPRLLSGMSSLVVLPVLAGEKTAKVIDSAIDTIASETTPGASLMFLQGTARLRVYDRARARSWVMRRDTLGEDQHLSRGARLAPVKTQVAVVTNDSTSRHVACWWLIQRRFGRDGDDLESRAREQKAIREAVRELPGPNWSKVETAHAAVAFPMSLRSDPPSQLAAEGRICIGLPTRQASGTPVWLDGPFHGNVPRTAVDFKETEFNRLVFDECVLLFWEAIDWIKRHGSRRSRRWLLCCFHLGEGPLADSIRSDKTLQERPLVLARKGGGMLAAAALRIPFEEDAEKFYELFGNLDIGSRGFCLPDGWLLRNCRPVLAVLAGGRDIELARSVYVQRNQSGESLLEEAARLNRSKGTGWWSAFLTWAMASFEQDQLLDQAVLPISGGRLMRPEQNVFFKPLIQGAAADDDEDEEAVEDLGDELFGSLQFLDETCVPVRRKDRPRQLTELARVLSPDVGDALVQRPRRLELINEVLGPELARRIALNPSDQVCLTILKRVADWLSDMPAAMRARVRSAQLTVPTGEATKQWAWQAADEVYFGSGWLQEPRSALLESAYGDRRDGRLPPWPTFAAWAESDDEQRPAWYARMATLGVHALPRIIEAKPRQAFFKSQSSQDLAVDGTPECAIPAAAACWPSYLRYASNRRATAKKKGQLYFVSSVSWIDGLENATARPFIIKLVLTNPAEYERHLIAKVQHQDGSDPSQVWALWVSAVWAERWAVIPSEKGPRYAGEVWSLGAEERGRRFVEAGLIFALPEEFNGSRTMREAFGIYSTDRVPIARLVAELQRAAKMLETDGAHLSTVSTLVQTLYEWLNRRCEGIGSTGKALDSMLAAPLPLMRDAKLVAAPLKSSVIYLNDDPERAARIPEFSSALSLPISAKGAFEALFVALKDLLGADRVRRVSTEQVSVQFELDESRLGGLFVELLGRALKGITTDVRRDLAAVIAYGREQQPMDPSKETFKGHWSRVCAARVSYGRFPLGDSTEAFFDEKSAEGPTLYVASQACAEERELLRLGWHLVGLSHQDAFELLHRELSSGRRDQFFIRKGIRDAEWDELDAVIGLGGDQLKLRLRALALAAWLRLGKGSDTKPFEDAWRAVEWNAPAIASWLGIDEGAATAFLIEARHSFSDEQQVRLLALAKLTIEDWQKARRTLQLDAYRFPASEQAFAQACGRLRAAVAVATSRYATVSAGPARQLADHVAQLACPEQIAERPVTESVALAAALSSAADLLEREAIGSNGLRMLARGMRKEALRPPSGWADMRLRGAPQRELRKFLDFDEEQRSTEAVGALEVVMRVATALAQLHGEKLSAEDWKQSNRIARFTFGWWSNPFAALRALHRFLINAAPGTATKLHAKRAFLAPRQWPELWADFPELGAPYKPGTLPPKPPPKKVRIFGDDKPLPEVEEDLSLGSSGALGSKLAACAAAGTELAAMAVTPREQVPDFRPSSKGGRGRGGGGGGQPDQQTNDLVGLLGEILVYEHLHRADYPEFSGACWVSENRSKYLGGVAGSVESGYDFKYRDVSGRLSGRADSPLCLIEVKSSSGDGTSPFPITWPEWRTAQDCHDSAGDTVYIIVRVRDVLGSPEIHDVIVDPVLHQKDGTLGVNSKDLQIRVGSPKKQ